MTDDRFYTCLPFILHEEGGNDDDPQDHGGRTSRGIIQREYNAYRKLQGKPAQDVWNATDEEVSDIYHHQYWQPFCPNLPPGVDLIFFDTCVLNGTMGGAKLLQRAIGTTPDGHIGLVTRAAIAAMQPAALIAAISAQRRAFYVGLHQNRFLRGWLNRVRFIESTALKMVQP